MSSEWLQVMMDEIARKKAESAAARAERDRRGEADEAAPPASGPSGNKAPRGGDV